MTRNTYQILQGNPVVLFSKSHDKVFSEKVKEALLGLVPSEKLTVVEVNHCMCFFVLWHSGIVGSVWRRISAIWRCTATLPGVQETVFWFSCLHPELHLAGFCYDMLLDT